MITRNLSQRRLREDTSARIPLTCYCRIFRTQTGTVLWRNTSRTCTVTSPWATDSVYASPLLALTHVPSLHLPHPTHELLYPAGAFVQHAPSPGVRAAEGRLHSRLRGASTPSRPLHPQRTQHICCRGIISSAMGIPPHDGRCT